jgi:hypothetical protein
MVSLHISFLAPYQSPGKATSPKISDTFFPFDLMCLHFVLLYIFVPRFRSPIIPFKSSVLRSAHASGGCDSVDLVFPCMTRKYRKPLKGLRVRKPITGMRISRRNTGTRGQLQHGGITSLLRHVMGQKDLGRRTSNQLSPPLIPRKRVEAVKRSVEQWFIRLPVFYLSM